MFGITSIIRVKAIFILVTLFFPIIMFSQNHDSLDRKYGQLKPDAVIDTLNWFGKKAYKTQDFRRAETYFFKALEYATMSSNQQALAKINNNIGIIEDTKGKFPEALDHYRKALNYYEQQADQSGIEKVLNNIGIVYEELNMFEQSLEYFKRSLKLKAKNPKKNFLSTAGTYNNIAIIYENYLHETDSALYYYKLALKNYKQAGFKNGKGKVCSNIGLLYFRRNELDKADSCYKAAFEVFSSSRNKGGVASVLFYKAKLAIERNKLNEAVSLLDESIKICKKLETKNLEKDIVKTYSEAYEKMGQSDSALAYYKQFHKLSYELINNNKINKIKSLKQKIEIDHKDYEISLLKKNRVISKLQQNRQFLLIIGLLLILASVIVVFYQILRKRRMKSEMELSKAKTRLLRTQMSPHFLFNSLMSIQTFLIEGEVKEASKYLTLLARLMRLLLTYSRESFITLEQEIEIIEYYLATEKLRFGDKINFKVTVDPDIDKNETQIPPLMIQPALENAIVHGLMPCNRNGNLLLTFTKSANYLVVKIEDNGIGYKSEKSNSLHTKKSFSTGIIKERIHLIEKQFGQHITYTIEEINPDFGECPGTLVTFKFPLS